ncbi:hypothetical protein Sru01_07630 [Sphaerisporangium rufum]|uniref:HEXXH motif-containing protein n=1 Tax=Sphaerisporangium rufum TaxID=1381558 RepID=A0A919QZS8_9ACTN|nr:HEXXH motif-containing putative peptide modification protein [Sphaerisporangium rufum]GII75781.1 hypothetical protein Sru01_07630 [Sphaerisporangium rufum]
MTVRLDTTTIASFAAPAGRTGPNRAVFAARYYDTLVGLRRLRDLLADARPDCLAESGYAEHLAVLSTAPGPVQRRVLGHPSAGFWVDVAWSLVRRRAHERFPGMHLVPHLREFARFAASAAVLAGGSSPPAAVRADRDGRVALPGAGLALRPRGATPYARTTLAVEAGEPAGGPHLDRVPHLAAGPELNWLDADLRLGGRTRYDFAVLAAPEAERWRRELDECFATVRRVHEPLHAELAGGLRAIVPIRAPDASTHVSGSFREAPGLVALALGTEVATVEALVHEYGHQKLYALMMLDPLIAGDTGEAVHYSPWRDDPRPLGGLLQAVYTFVSVLHFYRAALGTPGTGGLPAAEVITRAYQLTGQVRDGLAGLRERDAFSPLGRALAAALELRLAEATGDLPAPPAADRRGIDAARREHRARWAARNGPANPAPPGARAEPAGRPATASSGAAALPPADPADRDPAGRDPADRVGRAGSGGPVTRVAGSSGPVAEAGPDGGARTELEARTLRALGLPERWTAGAILRRWYPGDSLLERVRHLSERGELVLPPAPAGASLITDLAAAHAAYVRDDHPEAAARYAACVAHDPGSPYFWQCYAFALRHLGRHAEALYILAHTAYLLTTGRVPDPATDVRRTPAARNWGLALPPAGPEPSGPAAGPTGDAVADELRHSRYRDFVAATGGGQLPALIAVAQGLKPAMDVWIPPAGWPAFLRAADRLGLVHHVDACFDRHSPQLAQVPPDQLTTTRAGFSPELRPGTEAHVFLARDRAALDRVVGAGWYPLVIGGKVVNKHRADHDKFGDALGYPPCCQEFFRHRNNWHDDNTYYAALLATKGEPSAWCNPFLRHTMYGLVPYMPCSYACPATTAFAGRLRDAVAGELPEYLAAMERALRKPLLCVSELRMYWFHDESVTRDDAGEGVVTIAYRGVESLYPIEEDDPLCRLLASGDRLELDGEVIRVYAGDAYVGGHQARGDRHGPECPFVLTFAP